MTLRYPPNYWGPWFATLKDSDVKKTRLNIFYHLGEGLEDLNDLRIGMEYADIILSLIRPLQWLIQLSVQLQGVPMPDTRKSVEALLNFVNIWLAPTSGGTDLTQTFTQSDMMRMHERRDKFLADFEREEARLGVFIVTSKGLYDTTLLLEKPEEAFEEKIRGLLPPQMLYDFKQAARCLAFEIPTACAFHVCRGTESLMLAYYEFLAKHAWAFKKKDWGIYIEQLGKEGAPKSVTERLDEIRKLNRNAYIHPEINVSLDEAPNLFGLCQGVIFQMAREMILKP